MANEIVVVAENKNTATGTLASNFSVLATPDGIQQYILGTKKNGDKRAVYDIVKDVMKPKKKKKKHKKHNTSSFDLYCTGRKKKKKKKKKKHWHI